MDIVMAVRSLEDQECWKSHADQKGYLLPNDETEKDRLDMMHEWCW